MNIAIDVTHPSHAMMYSGIARELTARGHDVVIASRVKDVTVEVLSRLDVEHEVLSTEIGRGRAGQAFELVGRVRRMVRLIRQHDIDTVLARSPAGCIAAWLCRRPAIFDTDDGRGAGIHHLLAMPFATVVTSPAALGEEYGPRHVRYPSLKSLAYLHPKRFTVEPHIHECLGVSEGERIALLRLSAYGASHDRGRSGIGAPLARRLVDVLSRHAHVIISAEQGGEGELATSPILMERPDLLSSVLSVASLVVTDGASVAEEAAVLGTHAFWISDFVGSRGYLAMLEDRYSAVTSFRPGDEDAACQSVLAALAKPDGLKHQAGVARRAILSDHVDLVEWYANFVEQWAAS